MDDKQFFDNDQTLKMIQQGLTGDTRGLVEENLKMLAERLRNKPILTGEELMLLPADPNNYIIDKILWEGDVCLLLAKEKAGKSIFSLQMACALTSGENFLNEYEVSGPKKVLYVQAEGSREDTINNLKKMHEKIPWNPKNFYHMYPPSLALDTDAGLDDLYNKIINTGFKPEVIILDPLYMAMQGSLIDEKAARLFCRNIRRMKERFNCTIVVVHHKRRPHSNPRTGQQMDKGDDDVMGSFVWKAFPSHILNLDHQSNGIRLLTCKTQRGGAVVKDMKLELVEPSPLYFRIQDTTDCKPYVINVLNFFEKNKGKFNAQQLIEQTGLSESAIRHSLGYLVNPEVAKIYKLNPGGRPVYYKLRKKDGNSNHQVEKTTRTD